MTCLGFRVQHDVFRFRVEGLGPISSHLFRLPFFFFYAKPRNGNAGHQEITTMSNDV